jgi:hypothetical protein
MIDSIIIVSIVRSVVAFLVVCVCGTVSYSCLH